MGSLLRTFNEREYHVHNSHHDDLMGLPRNLPVAFSLKHHGVVHITHGLGQGADKQQQQQQDGGGDGSDQRVHHVPLPRVGGGGGGEGGGDHHQLFISLQPHQPVRDPIGGAGEDRHPLLSLQFHEQRHGDPPESH